MKKLLISGTKKLAVFVTLFVVCAYGVLVLKQARAGRGIAVCGSAAATGRRGCRWTFELWLVA